MNISIHNLVSQAVQYSAVLNFFCTTLVNMAHYGFDTIQKWYMLYMIQSVATKNQKNEHVFDQNWNILLTILHTVYNFSVFNRFVSVVSWAKYIQSDTSGCSMDLVLFVQWSKISFNKNPEVNFIVSVVVAFITNQLSANFSKSSPGFINFVAHDGNLMIVFGKMDRSINLQIKFILSWYFERGSLKSQLFFNGKSIVNSSNIVKCSYVFTRMFF